MSRFLHGAGHVALIGLGFAVQYGSFVPGKYKPLALAVQGLAQAILAIVNHDPVNK